MQGLGCKSASIFNLGTRYIDEWSTPVVEEVFTFLVDCLMTFIFVHPSNVTDHVSHPYK
jgi:hypothetical protein